MARPEKEAAVQEIGDILSSSKGVYLTDFTGLNVQAMTDLRRQLREVEVSYRVVKNSLFSLAVERAGLAQLQEFLSGPTGIAYTDGDPAQPAKVLSEFSQRDGRPEVKVCLVEGTVISSDFIGVLMKLPPRETLLAEVAGGIVSPLTDFVGMLDGILRDFVGTVDGILHGFVYVLDAIREQKEKEA